MEKKDVKIPFTVYDFFGYLACGYLMLVAVDYAFDVGWVAKGDLGIPLSLFWIIVAYIVGHLVAQVSGEVIERRVVRKLLRSPEELLFQEVAIGRIRWMFPGFYEPFPKATRERLLAKVVQKAGAELLGRALFLHCHPIVKREAVTMERLNNFLNLYGFCRNMSLALVLTIPVLLIGSRVSWLAGSGIYINKLMWAVAALVGSVGMFYRYLKFFRQYTMEVFLTYAELE